MRRCDPCVDADSSAEVTTSSSDSDSSREHSRKRSSKRKRSRSSARNNTASSDSLEEDEKHPKSRAIRVKGKKSRRRKEREEEERRRKSGEQHGKQHRKKKTRDREKRKRSSRDLRCAAKKEDASPPSLLLPKSQLQLANEAQMQQKELVWRNVEMAKAKLASGELQKKRHEQMEMQRLYGAVDWREKKKLRAEKSRLERTIAAGKKLAKIEERENARMDAFRIALGLPSAEAQRQAEWRAEATRALAEAESLNKDTGSVTKGPSRPPKVIGPRLPS